MPADRPSPGLQFLSVAEAAARLGLSRLKIREAAARGLLPAQRDNQGRLRVSLAGLTGAQLDLSGQRTDGAALMDLLFDEVEELHEALLIGEAEIEALKALAARQAQALDQAAERIEQDAAEKSRLVDLLARALDHLEAQPGPQREEKLARLSERALQHLEATGEQLESAVAQSGRFDQLLARAVALAEASKAEGADKTVALGEAVERAMEILARALSQAEADHHATLRSGDMLERALAAGGWLEEKLAAKEQEMKAQDRALAQAISVSERALALAGGQPSQRRWLRQELWQGFWQRLWQGFWQWVRAS